MESGSLNCPNCGAGIASDSTRCTFCNTMLKTMACPSCLGLMFVGSKFCEHCGAKAVGAELTDVSGLGDCPRCKLPLKRLNLGALSLNICEKCAGMWADVDTFEKVCAEREQQAIVLSYAGSAAAVDPSTQQISYVPCPSCKQLMNRSNFARLSGVVIDTCKQHGVWFDQGELPRIVDFVQKGGIERSRQHERLALEDERSRLRDEQRQSAFDRSDLGSAFATDDHSSAGIASFVRDLFD